MGKMLAVIGTIVPLLAFWFVAGRPLQKAVCEPLTTSYSVPEVVCAPEFTAVAQKDAEERIGSFLRLAGGADPANARSAMTDSAVPDAANFVSAWRNVLFADLVSVREGPQFNTFKVRYVSYSGDGDVGPKEGTVDEYEVSLRLERRDGDVLVSRIWPAERVTGKAVRYERTHTKQLAPSFNLIGGSQAAPSIDPRTLLSALCARRAPNGDWWTQTAWGVIPNDSLADASETKIHECGRGLREAAYREPAQS